MCVTHVVVVVGVGRGVMWLTQGLFRRGYPRRSRCGQRTAVNLPPPSSVLFGEQHIRMLEATQARSPQIAPTTPATSPPPTTPTKPIIEKMELPRVECGCAQETLHAGGMCVKCELARCVRLHSMLHLWPCAQPCECSVLVGTIYCVC